MSPSIELIYYFDLSWSMTALLFGTIFEHESYPCMGLVESMSNFFSFKLLAFYLHYELSRLDFRFWAS